MNVKTKLSVIEVIVGNKEVFKSILKGDIKERLNEIDECKNKLDHLRDKLIESTWKDYWAIEHATSVFWDCPDSPFGYCAYHKFEDRSWDNCLFCHQPYERK